MIVPRLWLAFLALAFAAAAYFSDRDWAMTDMPRIEALGTLEENPDLYRVLSESRLVPGMLPYTARQRANRAERAGRDDTRPQPKIGYSYREISILRVPVWGYKDQGLVVYSEGPDGYYFVPLDEAQAAGIDRITGSTHADYGFPIWKHLWGWLFLVGMIVWTFLHLRAGAKLAEEAEEQDEETVRA